MLSHLFCQKFWPPGFLSAWANAQPAFGVLLAGMLLLRSVSNEELIIVASDIMLFSRWPALLQFRWSRNGRTVACGIGGAAAVDLMADILWDQLKCPKVIGVNLTGRNWCQC